MAVTATQHSSQNKRACLIVEDATAAMRSWSQFPTQAPYRQGSLCRPPRLVDGILSRATQPHRFDGDDDGAGLRGKGEVMR